MDVLSHQLLTVSEKIDDLLEGKEWGTGREAQRGLEEMMKIIGPPASPPVGPSASFA